MNEWKEYVLHQAENYSVLVELAWAIFQMLGPSEAHDGFITEMENAAEIIEDDE